MSHNPNDPPLDRKAELLKEVDRYAFAVARKDPKEGGRAFDEIVGWLREVEDYAGRSSYNRAADQAANARAQLESIQNVINMIDAIGSSESNYRAVEADIRTELAVAKRMTERTLGINNAVLEGGAK